MGFAQRLGRMLRPRGYETTADLARRIGVKPGTLRMWVERDSVPKGAAPKLARALRVPLEWLVYGDGPPPPLPDENAGGADHRAIARAQPEIVTVRGLEFAAINRWDIRASAGPGALVAGEPEILHPTLFRLDWLRSLTRSPLEKLAVIQVQGDSLEPTLRNGDTVLIDMQQNRPARLDGIYAIQRDDDMQVKRLSVHPETGRLTIGSDNPAYPTYTNVDPEHVIVVGRVIWVGRRT